MYMSNALTTKARIKERLSITETGFDDLFDRLIVSVTKRIETMCNRQFNIATYTNEIHDGSDIFGSYRGILITKNAPIGTVTRIQYKSGTNENPNWTDFDTNRYDVDYDAGLIYFDAALPRGKRNIRITYSAGWDGFTVGITAYWNFNVVPTGTVDGSNRTFTLPEAATELVVYVDGVRELASNVTFTSGGTSFTLAAGREPYSSIAVDYQEQVGEEGSNPTLPADLVDVCERAVVYLFKHRENEGRTSESFQESSTTWRDKMFTNEMIATIKNYRRGYDL